MSGDVRSAVLARIVASLGPVTRPVLLAVDGPDGVGKTRFADDLGRLLDAGGTTVVRAGVDDFHHGRAHRHARGRTGRTVWERSYDYRALRRELVDPWLAGPGSAYRRRWHDLARDERVDEPAALVPDAGVLLLDGVFVQRAELAAAWDLVIYLDAPPEVTVPRLASRDGTDPDPAHPEQRRYLEAQALYRAACDPRGSADLVVELLDLTAPAVLDEPAPTCPTCGRPVAHGPAVSSGRGGPEPTSDG